MKSWPFIPLLALLAGCSQPAPPSSLSAFNVSSTTLGPQGGSVVLDW